MKYARVCTLVFPFLWAPLAFSAEAPQSAPAAVTQAPAPLQPAAKPQTCADTLKELATGKVDSDGICQNAQQLKVCESAEHRPIFHFDHPATPKAPGAPSGPPLKILAFALIHGDEPMSGMIAMEWIARLKTIEPRNSWRIVPLLNPDGRKLNTRTNAHGIDLNRNFPTTNWENEAMQYWKVKSKGEIRRFPGSVSASESETQCAMAQIKDFKPDLIVSIHTPYGVLDFDGPSVLFPAYSSLPWKSLGNFPGSLGRYMWKDHGVPVLTIELKTKLVDAPTIQDVIGQLAIASYKKLPSRRDDAFFAGLPGHLE
jgi:protein MpaA